MNESLVTMPGLSNQVKTAAKMWSLTPPPWERKGEVLYWSQEIKTILDSLKQPHRKAVVLTGKNGAGKTTMIVELAYTLQQMGKKFMLFSPDIVSPIDHRVFDNPQLPTMTEQLEKYAEATRDPALVLIDSGDHLFNNVLGSTRTYNDLRRMKATFRRLDSKEENALQHYRNCERMLQILKKPQFQIVTTQHTNWASSNREPTLFREWSKIIHEGYEYKLPSRHGVSAGERT